MISSGRVTLESEPIGANTVLHTHTHTITHTYTNIKLVEEVSVLSDVDVCRNRRTFVSFSCSVHQLRWELKASPLEVDRCSRCCR